MSIAPESAISPVAQAPSDRPTLRLEQWARMGIALLFGDRKLDLQEQHVLRAFMEEVALRAQAAQGIGTGQQSSPEGAAPPMSPMEMNANTEDFGAGQGEPMGEEGY